jgi:hypothetical protein
VCIFGQKQSRPSVKGRSSFSVGEKADATPPRSRSPAGGVLFIRKDNGADLCVVSTLALS